MGAVARPADAPTMRGPGQRRARLGPPGLGARRRHAAGRRRSAARARRPRGAVRRAAHAVSRAARSPRPPGCRSRTAPDCRRSSPRSRTDAADYDRDRERIDDAIAHPWRTALILLALGDDPCLPRRRRRLLGVRPRARAQGTTASTSRSRRRTPARARAHAAAAGWRGGLVRVHGDALRPRPPRRLPRRADDDRALDLGRAAPRAGARPRALRGQRGPRRCRPGRRRSRASSTTCSTAAPRCCPASASASRRTASRCPSGSRRSRSDVGNEVAGRSWFRSIGALPLVVGLVVFAAIGVLLGWLALDGWRSVYPRWSDVVLLALAVCSFVNAALAARGARPQAKALAAPLPRGRDRGRALGGVPPLPDRLPATRRGAAGLARALGALPRVRDRLRDRRPRAAGGPPAHARGAGAGELHLLDLARRRPRRRARRRSRSAISRPASAPPLRRPRPAPAAVAAASPAAVAAAAAAEAAASARRRRRARQRRARRARRARSPRRRRR